MKKTIKLLNPFSIRLEKYPIMEVENKPVYTDGDYRVYKYFKNHFIHTFKNIVISERGAINKRIFTNLQGETVPTDDAQLYYEYERPLEAKQFGLKQAAKLKFVIK